MNSIHSKKSIIFNVLCSLLLSTIVNGFTLIPKLSSTQSIRRSTKTQLYQASASNNNNNNNNDHFDMNELKRRIAVETSPFADLFHTIYDNTVPSVQTARRPENVYIVSFRREDGGNGGIHSIEYPKGSGNNVVLAFENKDACTKFANTLKAQHFFNPTTDEIVMDTLENFCDTLGVYVQLVPDGVELIPPSQNVEQLGRNNNHNHHNDDLHQQQNHLSYVYDMLSDDIEDDGVILAENESTLYYYGGAFE